MARNQKMDTIRTPDMKKLSKTQSDNINNFDRYSRAEDNSGKVRVSFDKATPMKELDSILAQKHEEKDEVEQMLEEFQPKRRNQNPKGALDKGVKINGTYVAKKRIISVIVTLVILLIFFALFVPPIYSADDEKSSCRYEDIFQNKGVTGYKSELIKDHYVYNLDALSSDKSENYRICTVAFEAKNLSPFAVSIDEYIVALGGDFKDNIVYSQSDEDSLTIPAFSTKTVTVEILVNRTGLSDDEFDKAVTTLTLSTKGMKKNISGGLSLPCIPAFMNVSDVISFDPDMK